MSIGGTAIYRAPDRQPTMPGAATGGEHFRIDIRENVSLSDGIDVSQSGGDGAVSVSSSRTRGRQIWINQTLWEGGMASIGVCLGEVLSGRRPFAVLAGLIAWAWARWRWSDDD